MIALIEQNRRPGRARLRILQLKRGHKWPEDGMRYGKLVFPASLMNLKVRFSGNTILCVNMGRNFWRGSDLIPCPSRQCNQGGEGLRRQEHAHSYDKEPKAAKEEYVLEWQRNQSRRGNKEIRKVPDLPLAVLPNADTKLRFRLSDGHDRPTPVASRRHHGTGRDRPSPLPESPDLVL